MACMQCADNKYAYRPGSSMRNVREGLVEIVERIVMAMEAQTLAFNALALAMQAQGETLSSINKKMRRLLSLAYKVSLINFLEAVKKIEQKNMSVDESPQGEKSIEESEKEKKAGKDMKMVR